MWAAIDASSTCCNRRWECPSPAANTGIPLIPFGGGAFDGAARFQEIRVRAAGVTIHIQYSVDIAPTVAAAPLALHAERAASVADGAIRASSIGEPCFYGQVLATDGHSWGCADSSAGIVSLTPSADPIASLAATVAISDVTAVGVKPDLRTLRAWTGVLSSMGEDLLKKHRDSRQ